MIATQQTKHGGQGTKFIYYLSTVVDRAGLQITVERQVALLKSMAGENWIKRTKECPAKKE